MFAFKKIINRDFDENLITIPDRPDELYYRKKWQIGVIVVDEYYNITTVEVVVTLL